MCLNMFSQHVFWTAGEAGWQRCKMRGPNPGLDPTRFSSKCHWAMNQTTGSAVLINPQSQYGMGNNNNPSPIGCVIYPWWINWSIGPSLVEGKFYRKPSAFGGRNHRCQFRFSLRDLALSNEILTMFLCICAKWHYYLYSTSVVTML